MTTASSSEWASEPALQREHHIKRYRYLKNTAGTILQKKDMDDMAKADIVKFRELLLTDADFQEKHPMSSPNMS